MHCTTSAVSELARVEWHTVGGICGRVYADLESRRGKGRFDGVRRIGIDETSRVLYTHRNTCIYRIQRMTELLGLDLGDPDTKLILSICLRILDREDDSPTVPGVPATG